MATKVKVKSGSEYSRWLRGLKRRTTVAIKGGMNAAGRQKVADDQATAPVLTGEYRDGIKLRQALRMGRSIQAAILYQAAHSGAVQARNPHHLPALNRLQRDVKTESEARLRMAQ